MENKTKAWVNAILLVTTLIVNGLGASGLINGLSQKAVSDMYPTLITPAPSTFAIWSVIYTLLIISVIVMIIKNEDFYYGRAIYQVSHLFWLSCVLNIVWVISFSYNLIALSTILIFALLIVTLLILKRIGEIQTKGRLLLPTTFGLYSGWLLIATVVNIALWLVKIEWDQFGIAAQSWSVVILSVAVVLTLIILLSNKNAIFPIPIAWAYFGINKSLLAQEGFQENYSVLQNVAIIGMVILIGLSLFQFYKNQYNVMPNVSIKKDE